MKKVIHDTLENMTMQAAIKARAELSMPYPLNNTNTWKAMFEMHNALGKLRKVCPYWYNGLRGVARKFVPLNVLTRCGDDTSSDYDSNFILLEAARFYEMKLNALRAAA